MRFLKRLSIVGLFLALSACSFFSEKDNTAKPAELASFKPSLTVKKAWSTHATSGSGNKYLKLQPAISDGMLYLTDTRGNVAAINRNNGQTKWSVNTKAPITTGPSVYNDVVVFATGDARVIALEQATGKKLWQAAVANEVLAPLTIGDNKVFVKSIDGQVSALELKTGHALWKYDHSSPNLILRGGSAPQLSGDKLVVGFADGQLDVLLKESGKLLWQRQVAQATGSSPVERMIDIDADPIVNRGIVYVATYQGNVAADYVSTGHNLWKRKMSSYTGLALSPDNLYVSDDDGYIWAIERKNGNVLWKQDKLRARHITGPALVNNRYLVTADKLGYLHFLSRHAGLFVAREKVSDDAIIAPLAVADNMVYVYSVDGQVTAYQVA